MVLLLNLQVLLATTLSQLICSVSTLSSEISKNGKVIFVTGQNMKKGCFHYALFTSIQEKISVSFPTSKTGIPMATTMLMKSHGTVDKYL
jgi:hypothetical protein